MNYTELRTQNLESLIRGYLTGKRLNDPDNYAITMLTLYEYVTTVVLEHHRAALYLGLPTGIFNKIVGDMKRAGIIGMAKGGDIVFLSNAAWELYTKKNASNQLVINVLAGSTTTSNEVSK
jgi:CRP-like cAMP-binding protein